MKDILLFDLDGTLFNTKEGIVNCVLYALEYYGIKEENPDNLNKFIGPPLHVSFQQFYGFSEEKAMEAAAKYRERYKDNGIYECTPYEGIYEALEMIKKSGKHMGVATSKPEIFAKKILERFNMDNYFEYVTGSLLDNSRSSKNDVIIEALRRFGVENQRDRVLMIGDRKHDILGAKATGLESLGVTYGFAEENELQEAGADYIVDTPLEIAQLTISL